MIKKTSTIVRIPYNNKNLPNIIQGVMMIPLTTIFLTGNNIIKRKPNRGSEKGL